LRERASFTTLPAMTRRPRTATSYFSFFYRGYPSGATVERART
jgi:hypothetical protein